MTTSSSSPEVRRCARCGTEYFEEENGDDACAFHPGECKDYDTGKPGGYCGDYWSCCMRQLDVKGHAPGCTKGRHIAATSSGNDP